MKVTMFLHTEDTDPLILAKIAQTTEGEKYLVVEIDEMAWFGTMAQAIKLSAAILALYARDVR